MKKLSLICAGYFSCWAVVGWLWLDWTNAAAERGRHAIVLGEQHAAQLPAPEQLPPLAEACHGKLDPTDAHGLAGYVAKTAVKPTDDNAWDEVLVGVTGEVVRERKEHFVPAEPLQALTATLSPLDWQPLLARAKTGSPGLAEARYLVVAKYFSLQPPVSEGDVGYTRGGGAFSARVVGFRDGDVLCEGSGEVHMKEAINAAGRGGSEAAAKEQALTNAAKLVPFVFSLSVTASPLHAVCDVGGESLCQLTSQWVGR